jgi:DNA-binding response OmpR family regulator
MTTSASAGSGGATAADAAARVTVLLVEDDPSIGGLVRTYLGRDGYPVVWVRSGEAALDELARHDVGMVVLDVGLPGIDGFDVCRRMRATSRVPIVMLTARDEEPDRVAGLELGADDYLTKPFSPRELVARVRAILRRTEGGSEPLVAVMRFDEGALEIDTVQHEVRRDGTPVELTPNEYKLLTTLARYPGRAYSRFELINHVQGYEYEGYERTIDAHVKNLRKKIEADPRQPRYVETIFGVGYRLAKG